MRLLHPLGCCLGIVSVFTAPDLMIDGCSGVSKATSPMGRARDKTLSVFLFPIFRAICFVWLRKKDVAHGVCRVSDWVVLL